jgi:hypothetical protein
MQCDLRLPVIYRCIDVVLAAAPGGKLRMLTPVHSVEIELRCQQLDEGAPCWQGCPGVRARTVDMADLAVAGLDRFTDSDIRYIIKCKA